MRETNSDPRKHDGTSSLGNTSWDRSTHEKFYEYYAKESQSPETRRRFCSLRDTVLRMLARTNAVPRPLDVADIGCGAGTQCLLWAEMGHRVHGIDVSEALLDLATERAARAGRAIDLRLGSAVALPWEDQSMDVCLAIELLEHVADWQGCLREAMRVLRRGGALLVTTTNWLCPVQEEFNLPLYSWYPTPLKRYCERLALTTRPQLANYAKYPAVSWFSFYSLRARLREDGCQCFDRFDATDLSNKSAPARWIISAVRAVPLLRWLGHVATPGTILLAIKAEEK